MLNNKVIRDEQMIAMTTTWSP